VVRKAARTLQAQPMARERMAPITRTPVAMPVAITTRNPIRPEEVRPTPLFDRDMPTMDEEN
jgi:hypothetical protein